MSSSHPPLLATKLFIPPPRPKAVRRPRLVDRLDEGMNSKLTLISAPAGFGKTTLVSEWIPDSEWPVAWLSLDEEDGELHRFLTYFIAALRKVTDGVGEGVLAMLESPQPPPVESMLTVLLNDIAAIPDHFMLVLDDYHAIDSEPVDRSLGFLIEYLPPQMHLIVTTREDPQLPLARLRVRGELTEIRAADLRFTDAEAAAFLNEAMDLNLTEEAVAALEHRTEGWIAGLQLAALSMQDRADTANFVEAFAGSHRFVLDYLIEEVLHRQSEQVRDFLLRTAILERLSGPLCDAVTGREDSRSVLENLERGNLFVIPLDDRRQWYRYHHLFADVLRARSMEEQPERMLESHRRASVWYEQNDLPAEAIHHGLAAKDFERTAALVERAWPEMDSNFQTAVWLRWARVLPEAMVRRRPVLLMGIAWAYLNEGQLESGETWLREIERWVDIVEQEDGRAQAAAAGMIVDDEEQFRHLPASVLIARTYYTQALGDISGTVAYARRALDRLAEDDHIGRGQTGALLGLTYWATGELEAAYRVLADAMDHFRIVGNISFAISATYGLADIRLTQGRLREAARTYQRSLRLVEALDPPPPGTAELYMGLASLYLEQNDLEAAAEYLRKSEELGIEAALPNWPWRFCIAQAELKEAMGDPEAALNLLEEAERLYQRTPVPEVRPIAALKARLQIRRGKADRALRWASERGLSAEDALDFLDEFEHFVLAALLIERYRDEGQDSLIQDADQLLERLEEAAEAGDRNGSLIEILIQQALARETEGQWDAALSNLERALQLAAPEGYGRVFVNEGPPMQHLLSQAVARGIYPDYASRLLAAFPEAADQPSAPLSSPRAAEPLVEPLSDRELEILGLIAQGLSNRQISERLFLALSTVKGHNQNIFGKLGVRRRTEAVARAQALGLL